ncbi:hypothetical protein LTR97_000167 [Elasticomyces elasticus]|uniref:Uncharacterized protein n=1 Tax=Elasticomyces elasticus TaxID=574655 RepID=A0AAN7ZWA0_9PEZI|nr:hypothetical protein LTR97_000167 [Elasticomyces elasticus]
MAGATEHSNRVHRHTGWDFVDLNGDHKDDLVWVDGNGQVTTWINRRGWSVGLGPAWVSHGVTHQGSGSAVNLTWGASLGSGRADYALSSIQNGNVYVERWKNQDQGGTMDMTGSGSDDYVFINSSGAITLFENDHNWGYWIPWGVIYNAQHTRPEIHLADFTGDGKCDILLVDRDSGATTVIQNNYDSSGFHFTNLGVQSGAAICTEAYGYNKHDRGVRWSDIDGDGRADFLCMSPNGLITGYLNKGPNNMVDLGQVKKSEGKERANIMLADINGDGRDDYLFIDSINGSVTAWMNGGQIESSGSAYQWNWKGVVATGAFTRGACIEFGKLYGLGRADYIAVEPASNKAWTWFNVCPEGAGAVAPSLPSAAPVAPIPVQPGSTGLSTTTATLSDGESPTSTKGSGSGGAISTGGSGYVTIDPDLWVEPVASQTVQCYPPCTYVMPPYTLGTPTTFSFPPIVTALTIGGYETVTQTITGYITTLSRYAISILTTTITIPAVTTSVISWFDITVTSNSTILYLVPSITQTSYIITEPRTFYSTTRAPATRTFYPPPWPGSTVPPTLTTPKSTQLSTTTTVQGGRTVHHTRGAPGPLCTRAFGCGSHCNPLLSACSPCWFFCDGPPSLDGLDPGSPVFPGNPGEPDDENGCETSTYSDCSTVCAQATPTSCKTSCITSFICDGESTETSSCVLLPTATNTFVWPTTDADLPQLGGGGLFGSIYLGAMSTSASFSPTRLKGDTTVDPLTDPVTANPTTKSASPTTTKPATTRTTTIYVLSTKTTTLTSRYTSALGFLRVSANIRTQVLANALFQAASTTPPQSAATLAPRANIVLSDYNLNYYPRLTGTTSNIDPCTAGNFYVYGVGTPTPKSWYDFPATVAFVSTISLNNGIKLSSCSYTNPAAPSVGVGGKVFCGASTYQCSLYTGGGAVQYCNPDELAAGYLTTMEVLAECGVSTTSASVVTTTTVVTVATSISTIVS